MGFKKCVSLNIFGQPNDIGRNNNRVTILNVANYYIHVKKRGEEYLFARNVNSLLVSYIPVKEGQLDPNLFV